VDRRTPHYRRHLLYPSAPLIQVEPGLAWENETAGEGKKKDFLLDEVTILRPKMDEVHQS